MMINPFDEMNRMTEEINRIFNGRFPSIRLISKQGNELAKQDSIRMPVSDIRETESSVLATFELPGADKKDIDLNITDEMIEVKVGKKTENEVKDKKSYRFESKTSHFYRALPLPAEVDSDHATAIYKDGILKVQIPKVKKIEAKKKKIQIN